MDGEELLHFWYAANIRHELTPMLRVYMACEQKGSNFDYKETPNADDRIRRQQAIEMVEILRPSRQSFEPRVLSAVQEAARRGVVAKAVGTASQGRLNKADM
ncbi:MAG: hypothetical protein C5B51_17485 [Terriglobia bacterium]|nr:MAG: hypothetical protein C5B51_17485 [Terriglobia bacterium]